MARLSAGEFDELIDELLERQGFGRLQGKLLRSGAVVSKRAIRTPEALRRHLYLQTAGLARDGFASEVMSALWEEILGGAVDEDRGKQLEGLAERINECLGPQGGILEGREDALRVALSEYRAILTDPLGDRGARLTILIRALPSVADTLRAEDASAT